MLSTISAMINGGRQKLKSEMLKEKNKSNQRQHSGCQKNNAIMATHSLKKLLVNKIATRNKWKSVN